MAAKRKYGALNVVEEKEEDVDPSDKLMFLGLGGCNEVGRSCHILQYKGKTIMLDAGMHPAYNGLPALPFFDEFDLSTVDLLLISHFHVDHAAGLPYVLAHTNFKGRVFMTPATKAIYKYIIQDSVRVGDASSSAENSSQIYTEADHKNTLHRIETIDFYTTHTISGIRITPLPAGHVLGAAMLLMEIADLRILFTGDYSREPDRHLIPASVPPNTKIDVLITESTFGASTHSPRKEREAALMRSITSTLDKNGRVLMPVFALGRAQELLLILDEYWHKHSEYRQYPIFYASALARRCMAVYQQYMGSMNDNIKRLFQERLAEAEASGKASTAAVGPWDFRYIRSLRNLERFDDSQGCVMLASPGMMQSGVSRQLLERWAPNANNAVIITGYSIEGTMARDIMHEPDEFPAIMTKAATGPTSRATGKEAEQAMIKRRCGVAEISFAAHVDGAGNQKFIDEISAPVVILVHGERTNMARLKSNLLGLNKHRPEGEKMKIYSPANVESVYIPIVKDKTAKVVGKLAERIKIPQELQAPTDDSTTEGDDQAAEKKQRPEDIVVRDVVLVQDDLNLTLMDVEDLQEYAGLTVTTITCRHKLTLASASLDLIIYALKAAFGNVVELPTQKSFMNGSSNGDTFTEKPKKEEEVLNGTLIKTEPSDDFGADAAPQSTSSTSHLQASSTSLKDGKVDDDDDDDVEYEIPFHIPERRFLIMDTVQLIYQPSTNGDLEIEWEGGMMSDAIADSVISTLATLEISPASIKQSSLLHEGHHQHGHDDADGDGEDAKDHNKSRAGNAVDAQVAQLLMLLEAQFGEENIEPITMIRNTILGTSSKPEEVDGDDQETNKAKDEPGEDPSIKAEEEDIQEPSLALKITEHGKEATLYLESLEIEGNDVPLRERVKAVIDQIIEGDEAVWQRMNGFTVGFGGAAYGGSGKMIEA